MTIRWKCRSGQPLAVGCHPDPYHGGGADQDYYPVYTVVAYRAPEDGRKGAVAIHVKGGKAHYYVAASYDVYEVGEVGDGWFTTGSLVICFSPDWHKAATTLNRVNKDLARLDARADNLVKRAREGLC